MKIFKSSITFLISIDFQHSLVSTFRKASSLRTCIVSFNSHSSLHCSFFKKLKKVEDKPGFLVGKIFRDGELRLVHRLDDVLDGLVLLDKKMWVR